MNYPFYIARKLSLADEGEKRSPAIAVAVTAVALSIAIMIASISIVFGFKREITNKVIGFNSHLSLTATESDGLEDNLVSLTPTLRSVLNNEPYITGYCLEVSMPAILKTPDNFKGVYLKALEGNNSREFINQNLISGKLPDFSLPENKEKVVISETASRQLGLKTGQKVNIYFITDCIHVRNMEIAGVFNTHFDAYDDIYIYGAMNLITEIAELPKDKGTNLKIYTDNFKNIDTYTLRLRERIDRAYTEGEIYKPYKIDNARTYGASYFRWLDLLDTNVVVILTLMTIVSVITLISGLLIIILDKIRFIGLMKALGTPDKALRRIFIYLSIRITVLGAIIGNGLAIGILALQQSFHIIPLDPENYYIDFVPVELHWPDIILLNAGVIAVVYVSLILPSRFVSKISPIKTMRYE